MSDLAFEGLVSILFILSWVLVRRKKRQQGILESVLFVRPTEASLVNETAGGRSTTASELV